MERRLISELTAKLLSYKRKALLNETGDPMYDEDWEPMYSGWTDETFDAMMIHVAECFEKIEALHKVDIQILQQDYKKEVLTQRLDSQPSKKMQVSISPERREDPEACLQIIDILRRATNNKFKPTHYVIEQRSETEQFEGFHIHMYGDSTIPPSKVVDYFKKLLTGARGKPKAQSQCSYANSNFLEKYMMGLKTDPDPEKQRHKLAAAAMDVKMREKYNLNLPEIFSPL